MILVTGATGFVGRHLCHALKAAGHEVRALVRGTSPLDVLPEGIHTAVGDVVTGHGLGDACAGCDTVVHLVSIIRETKTMTFDKVQVGGTAHLLAAATEHGVARIIYVSALGTGRGIPTGYFETKARAESLVRASGLEWAILRPAIVLGKGAGFATALTGLMRKGPVIPVAGSGQVRMEPIAVEDLGAAVCVLLVGEDLWRRVSEIGGPEAVTFNDLLRLTAGQLGLRKPLVHIPLPLMFPLARLMALLPGEPPVTVDELTMLAHEALCEPNALPEFGVTPTPLAEALAKSIGGKE